RGCCSVASFVDVPLFHCVEAVEAVAGSASDCMPCRGFVWFVSLGGRPRGFGRPGALPGVRPGPCANRVPREVGESCLTVLPIRLLSERRRREHRVYCPSWQRAGGGGRTHTS